MTGQSNNNHNLAQISVKASLGFQHLITLPKNNKIIKQQKEIRHEERRISYVSPF